MIEQYKKMKRQHPECMVLLHTDYGVYETFGDDAQTLADVCGLKAVFDAKLRDVVCIIRHYGLDECLQKLIAAGEKVAICETK